MKLNKEFLLHHTNGESLLIPTGNAGFSGIVRGNSTRGVLLDLLKTDTTEEELIAGMRKQFEAPEGAIEQDVKKALDELRGIGALDG